MMVPVENHRSRYRIAVRRTIAKRRAAIAALALMPGLACSAYDDAEVFGTATTVAANVPATDTVALEPTTTPTTPPTTTPSTVVPRVSAFDAGAELAVSFTFTPTSGGRPLENPFIAVWVEDTSGKLVRTISLWYEQTQEGPKWLSHLSRWTSATNAAVDTTTSGATRVPGEYTVAWDGVADDRSVIADGDYVLFVEAARRGGAYDITTTPIAVTNSGFSVQLPDSGELTAVSAELVA